MTDTSGVDPNATAPLAVPPAVAPTSVPVVPPVDPNASPSPPPVAAVPAAAAVNGAADRISQLTGEKWAERRAREAVEAENALLQEQLRSAQERLAVPAAQTHDPATGLPIAPAAPQAPALPPGTRAYTPEQIQREIANAASMQAGQLAYKALCDDILIKGRTAHPAEFDTSIGALLKFGPIPQSLIEAAAETGKAPEVIHALGKDPTEADRILSLTGNPVRQAAAIASFAAKLAAKPIVSSAPAPIDPATGRAAPKSPDMTSPDMPIDDWMKRRNKEIRDKERERAAS